MTAPTREEVARGLRIAASESNKSLPEGGHSGVAVAFQSFGAMADYVLGLIRDERAECAKVCADRALLSHDNANALEVGGNSKAAEAAFRERDEAEACAAAIRSRGAS